MRYFLMVITLLFVVDAYAKLPSYQTSFRTEKGVITVGERGFVDGVEDADGRVRTLMEVDVYPDEVVETRGVYDRPACELPHGAEVEFVDITERRCQEYFVKVRPMKGECSGWVRLRYLSDAYRTPVGDYRW